MKAQQCFLHHRNNVYAVLNWRVRKIKFDVMLLDPLDTQQFGRYQKLMKEGFTDESIFKKFYPEKITPKKKVPITIELLSKEQLTHLVNYPAASCGASTAEQSSWGLPPPNPCLPIHPASKLTGILGILINTRLGKTLTSMIRMSTEDLRSLFLEIEELASAQ